MFSVIYCILLIKFVRVGFLIKLFKVFLCVVLINWILCFVIVCVVVVLSFVLILLMMIILGIWFLMVLIIIWCWFWGFWICIWWVFLIDGWGKLLLFVILFEVLIIMICFCKLLDNMCVILWMVVVFLILGWFNKRIDFCFFNKL